MTGPSLRLPFTPAEQAVAGGIRRNRSYDEIASELACRPRTVRAHVNNMAAKIDGMPDELAELPPRFKVRCYLGLVEWTATQRERFFKTA